jgi:hypothetical protein
METKEKAQELFDKYFLLTANAIDDNGSWVVVALNKSLAKQCAIIAVDFYLTEFESWAIASCCAEDFEYDYWEQVKTEIEKI